METKFYQNTEIGSQVYTANLTKLYSIIAEPQRFKQTKPSFQKIPKFVYSPARVNLTTANMIVKVEIINLKR